MSIVAQVALSGGANTVTPSPAGAGSYGVALCNSNSTPVTFSLQLVPSGQSATAARNIESGATIAPNDIYERTVLPIDSGDFFVITPSGTGVSVTLWRL